MKKSVIALILSSFTVFSCAPIEPEEAVDEVGLELGEGADDSDATSAARTGIRDLSGAILAQIVCDEGATWVDGSNGNLKDGELQEGECTVLDSTQGLDSDEVGLGDADSYNNTSAWVLNMHKKLADAKTAADLQTLAATTVQTYTVFTLSPDYIASLKAGTAKGSGVVGPGTAARIQRLRVMIVMNDMMQMAIRAKAKDLGVVVNF